MRKGTHHSLGTRVKISAAGIGNRRSVGKNLGNQSSAGNKNRLTHGMSGWPEYGPWINIKTRCTNPNHTSYKNYGGKGITVYAPWLNSFVAFYEYMGSRPEGTSIGRFGDTGNYEPGNVKWMTKDEQVVEAKIKRMFGG